MFLALNTLVSQLASRKQVANKSDYRVGGDCDSLFVVFHKVGALFGGGYYAGLFSYRSGILLFMFGGLSLVKDGTRNHLRSALAK